MLYLQIILGLASTVSAIDAYFHLGSNCDGPATLCGALQPGTCCVVGGSNSVAYRGIPTNWAINVLSFIGGGCNQVVGTSTARNTNYVCFAATGFGSYTGSRYSFASKRAEASSEALACPEVGADEATGQPCTSSQKPDQLVLVDGTRYNIIDLEEDVLNEMVCYTSLTHQQSP